jgi:hypothetical protein
VLWGRFTSVDYGKQGTALNFLALYGKWHRVDAKHGRLTLRAGHRVYGYQTGDSQVSVSYASALDIASTPAPRVDYVNDLDKLAAIAAGTVPSAGILMTLAKAASSAEGKLVGRGRTLWFVIISAATLGSGALGYHLGHRVTPDYDSEVFTRTLQDVRIWTSIERSWRDAYDEAVKDEVARRAAVRALVRDWFTRNIILEKELQRIVVNDPHLLKVFRLHPEIEDQIASDPALRTPEHDGASEPTAK